MLTSSNAHQKITPHPKTIAILQPSYLPWLGYFDQIARSDLFVLYDDVAYDKHGWRNRNRIKGGDAPLWLTVPVLNRGRTGQKLCEVEIDNTKNWQTKHLKSLTQYYHRSRYYHEVMGLMEDGLNSPASRLVGLTIGLIRQLMDYLSIRTPLVRSSELDIPGERTERLVRLCNHFEATRYLTGDAAKSYLDETQFTAHHITVEWHNYTHPTYAQPGLFVPYLSIVDLLFHHGPDSLKILSNTQGPRE